jgi:hypothetical protein
MRERGVRTWVGRALVAVVVAAGVNLALAGLDTRHDAVLVTLLTVTVVAAVALAVDAIDSTTHLPWTAVRGDARLTSGEDTRTAMFRHMVEVHQTSYDGDDAVLWQIADLAARRLRQVHGIRYADDPDRATELLGPVLADWVARDRRSRYRPDAQQHRYTPAALGQVLDRIESL